MTSAPIIATAPRLPLTASVLSLAFTVLVAILGGVAVYGGLLQRVEAMERTVEPVRQGRIAVLDERTARIEGDVRWIRERMERDQ